MSEVEVPKFFYLSMKPGTKGLLKTIKGFEKTTNII